MHFIHLFSVLFVFIVLIGCGNSVKHMPRSTVGDTIQMKYAKLLHIVKYDDHAEICISDPWHKGRILHKYKLVSYDDRNTVESASDETILRIPLKKTIPFSIVYASLLKELGCIDAIVGLTDIQYVRDSLFCHLCHTGEITDVGNSLRPNIERIMDVLPDALLVSPFDDTGGYGRLESIGVPIIECVDYLEDSALGRAEWIKFFGLIYGRENVADSLFSVMDSNYCALKKLASAEKKRPQILMDKKTGPVWYVPGGGSTIGSIIKDANAWYAFSDNSSPGSLALSFEKVLEKAEMADIWVLRYGGSEPISYESLLEEFPGYENFKAFKIRNCFGCNVDKTKFYEETPFHPDYLLADFIQMAHPEVKGIGGLKYFRKIK